MVQKVVIDLRDDIDGSPGERTVTFSLDGKGYEIDLSAKHIDELQDALSEYIRCGRRVKHTTARAATTTAEPTVRLSSREAQEAKALRQRQREWGMRNGWVVGPRGRIPADLLTAYNAAQASAGAIEA